MIAIIVLAIIFLSIKLFYDTSQLFDSVEKLKEEISELRRNAGKSPHAPPQNIPQPPPTVVPEPLPPLPIPTINPVQIIEQQPIPHKIEPSFKLPEIDWEKFTGVKLFAWLGGLTLFLGAAFFAKYSIDHNLISPQTRLILVSILGIATILGGFKMHGTDYRVTSQTLCASGIAVLYADIFAASSHFHFIPMEFAFVMMVLVTTTSFLLAVRLDSKFVAVLGLVGGFLTPVLLSTGEDNPFGLFGYITILDLGLLAVALRKRWGFICGLSAIGTLIMQCGWVMKFFEPAKVIIGESVYLLFAGLYLAFYALNRRKGENDPWFFWPGALMPMASILFCGYLLSFSSLAARPGVLFSALFLVAAAVAGVAYMFEEFEKPHLAAGLLTFFLLGIWTSTGLTRALLSWGLSFYFLYGVLYAAYSLLLRKKRPDSAVAFSFHAFPLLMLLLVVVGISFGDKLSLIIWPFLLLLNAVAVISSVFFFSMVGVAGACIATFLIFGIWFMRMPPIADIFLTLSLLSVFSLGFFALGLFLWRKREILVSEIFSGQFGKPGIWSEMNEEILKWIPALSSFFPFFLLSLAFLRLELPTPHEIYFIGALMTVLLLSLVRYYHMDMAALLSLGGVLLVEYSWYAHTNNMPTIPSLSWNVFFFFMFFSFPIYFFERFKERYLPWLAAAAAGPLHFYLFYQSGKIFLGNAFIGAIPAVMALYYLLLVIKVVRNVPAESDNYYPILGVVAAVALLFISLIFPIQFEKQWITIGWAIEGLALVWLYRRVPYGQLQYWAIGLLTVVFIRLTFNPAIFSYHPRSAVPIFNWYLYTYGIGALCLITAGKLWKKDLKLWGEVSARGFLYALGTILLFWLMNIEIADYFSTGNTLTFQFSGNLAQDMSYSLGWAIFAVILLTVGIYNKSKITRSASLILLTVTSLKLFLHDLWRLGQLYRVGAFIGLAIIMMLVSFLYQRFISPSTAKPNEIKS